MKWWRNLMKKKTTKQIPRISNCWIFFPNTEWTQNTKHKTQNTNAKRQTPNARTDTRYIVVVVVILLSLEVSISLYIFLSDLRYYLSLTLFLQYTKFPNVGKSKRRIGLSNTVMLSGKRVYIQTENKLRLLQMVSYNNFHLNRSIFL